MEASRDLQAPMESSQNGERDNGECSISPLADTPQKVDAVGAPLSDGGGMREDERNEERATKTPACGDDVGESKDVDVGEDPEDIGNDDENDNENENTGSGVGEDAFRPVRHRKEAEAALLQLPREPSPPIIWKIGARMALRALKQGYISLPKQVVERDTNDVDGDDFKRKLRDKVMGCIFDPADVRREVCQMAGVKFCKDNKGDDGQYDGVSEVYHISKDRIDSRIRRVGACAFEKAVAERMAPSGDGKPCAAIDVTDMASCRKAMMEALIGNVTMSQAYCIHNVGGQIDRERVDCPIIVLGMPRTGTTFLFDLLNTHEGVRAPRNYEASWPICPNSLSGMEFRYKNYLFYQMMFVDMSEMHTEELDSPCELNRILKHSLGGLSWHLEMYDFLREYDRWWYDSREDIDDDWRFFRQQLQTMQAMRRATRIRERKPSAMGGMLRRCFTGAEVDGDGEQGGFNSAAPRWLLKDPQFSMIEHICRTFPGATIVVTHRNLTQALPSLFSMRARVQEASASANVFRDAGADTFDAYIEDQVQGSLREMQHFRDRAVEDPSLLHGCNIVDVRFHELIRQPLETCERIFDTAGLEMTELSRRRLREAVDASNERLRGKKKHTYDCADFGVDRDGILRIFEEYHRKYGV